jgi:hypothetical protein
MEVQMALARRRVPGTGNNLLSQDMALLLDSKANPAEESFSMVGLERLELSTS